MKNIRGYIIIFIFGALIFSISAVFAYSYFAQNIGFSSNDNEWDAENTKEALDDLYTQTKEYNSLKSYGMLGLLKLNTTVDGARVINPFSTYPTLYLRSYTCTNGTVITYSYQTKEVKVSNFTLDDECTLEFLTYLEFSETLSNLNTSNRASYEADSYDGGNEPLNAINDNMAQGNDSNWYGGTKLLVIFNTPSMVSQIGVYTTNNWGYAFTSATIYYSEDDSLTLSSNLNNFNKVTVQTESLRSVDFKAKRIMLTKASNGAVYEFVANGYKGL